MHSHENFQKALLFLHVAELKGLCGDLGLPEKGNKWEIVQRIAHFVKTGEILKSVPIPRSSKAVSKKPSSLEPDSYILHGVYKNDLKTRLFFKKMIGEHFHFTAFGIDWINQRWMEGNPPTYREFATFWEAEYARRKKSKAEPKQEWAYINFVQEYIKKHSEVTRDQIMSAWEEERQKNVSFVMNYLDAQQCSR